MALPLLGYGGYVGNAEEGTWGTPVSRTAWNFLLASGLRKTPVFAPFRHLSGAQGALLSRKYQQREDAGGSVRLIPDYASKVFSRFLKHALGSVGTSGSGPYTHTFTIAATLPVGLTVETGNATSYEVFEGCKVNTFRFVCAFGSHAEVEAGLIAQTSGGLTQPNSSYPTVSDLTYPILHSHAGTCSIGGNSYTLRRLEVNVNNSLARADQLGSHLTAEPFPTAHREYTAVVELYETNEVLEGDFAGGTETDCTITFSDGTRSLAWTLHNAYIEDRQRNQDSAGAHVLTLTLRGLNDGTDTGLKAVLINANSSAV